jgi:hypothetical protein
MERLGAMTIGEVEHDDAPVREHGVCSRLMKRTDEIRTLRFHADDLIEHGA